MINWVLKCAMNNTVYQCNKINFSLNIWKLSKMQNMQTLLTSPGNKQIQDMQTLSQTVAKYKLQKQITHDQSAFLSSKCQNTLQQFYTDILNRINQITHPQVIAITIQLE